MMQWINQLFNSEKPAAAAVKKEGTITVEGDKVIYAAREGYRKTFIDLTQLQYIYVYTTENTQNLVLNDYSQHLIPSSVNGFESFFQYLASRFSLNEAKFREILASKKPHKAELWRTGSPDNCQIVTFSENPESGKRAFDGFWICSSPPQWINWDMTSQELADSPLVFQKTSEYGLTEIRFKHPVRIGSLQLDDLRYSFPAHLRLDVPLDDFYANLRIDGNGDQNYFLAKKALGEMFGEPVTIYERKDQNSCQWIVDGIQFALIYWYDGPFSYQSGYTYLNVKNQRKYHDYLTDADYELNIQMSRYLPLPIPFLIGSNFRQSQYFQQTPEKVTEQLRISAAQFMIWQDKANRKVGFANQENAMIFPLDSLAGFQCQNVVPDRSSGGVYFMAILQQGSPHCIMIGDCHSLDAYLGQLEELVSFPVTKLETYE